MGMTTEIAWTDATWNPWQGCTKVSPACANCYMFADLKRYGRDPSVVVRSKPPTFRLPLKKRRGGEFAIAPGWKVFTCSWSDWFHQSADAWRDDAWDIVRSRPDVTFQILTKRPERIAEHLPADWGDGWKNVWLGVTAEDQERWDERTNILATIEAAVRFVSAEPLLGRIDANFPYIKRADGSIEKTSAIDWVIVGGEAGHNSRPMHPDWARSLRDQCQAAGVRYFFKQWGDWMPWVGSNLRALPLGDYRRNAEVMPDGVMHRETIGHGGELMARVGKKAAGYLLDGREWSEFPARIDTALTA